jgi:hypothetical protein
MDPASIMALSNMVLGGIQAGTGLYGLNQLSKTPYPEFSITPGLQSAYGRAEGMANQGFTPAEQAAFQQRMAGTRAGAFRRGAELSGGQLAGALNRGLQAQQFGAENQFAAQGAQLQRSNTRYADSLAQAIQNQSNMATQAQIGRRNAQEQAYGGAVKAGLGNIANTLNLNQALSAYGGGGNKPQSSNDFMRYASLSQPNYGISYGTDPASIPY